jgi:group I intron endonuclease
MICGIYSIIHKESLKCYIGQSKDISKRFANYKRLACKGQIKLYNALLKYGIDAFDFEIIEECKEMDLDNKEKFWINFYKSISNGYNSMEGGRRRMNYSDLSIREKISKANKGRVQSVEEIDKRTKSLTGLKRTETTKERIRFARIGQKHKLESIEKMKKSLKALNKVPWNKGKTCAGWSNSGTFKIGGIAPLKGRKRIIDTEGKIRYVFSEDNS